MPHILHPIKITGDYVTSFIFKQSAQFSYNLNYIQPEPKMNGSFMVVLMTKAILSPTQTIMMECDITHGSSYL